MDRDSWLRAIMVFTILGLLGLVLVTPGLLGRQAELASLPLLVIGMTQDRSTFVIDVSGAIQVYLYANITLEVSGIANTSYMERWWENDTYNVHARIAVDTEPFRLRTYLEDRQDNYFEYNVTVDLLPEENGERRMQFLFPDEPSADAAVRIPPDDLRVAVPLRGSR